MFTNLAILGAPPCTIWGFPKIGLPQKRWMVYSEKNLSEMDLGTPFQEISNIRPDLVGGLEHFLFFHILGTIIPSD